MKKESGAKETFIFLLKGKMIKVVIDFNKNMCTVYFANGRILLRKEKMETREMNILRGQINQFIKEGNNWRHFRTSIGEWGLL